MHCFVNNERRALPSPPTVAGLLAALDLAGRKVAVEKNGAVVPKSEHAQTAVGGGDKIEIVTAVGGG